MSDTLTYFRESLRRSQSGDPSARRQLEERLNALLTGEHGELLARWLEARSRGDNVSPEEFCAGDPARTAALTELIRLVEEAQAYLTGTSATATPQEAGPADPTDGRLPTVPGYELLDVLGRGGMGVVYRARQLGFNRVVALKMIRTAAEPLERRRFRTEAEAVARLRHANIVQVHDIGEADGCPYFSMEHLEGGSLSKRAKAEPLSPRRAAEVVEALARAMQHTHEAGVVHRDLKPSNVLLDADGTPKVADFGLAKLLDADATRTAGDAVLGTACYMSPEQAAGRGDDVGPLSDVYGLGAILYDLLTGRPPIDRGSWAVVLERVRTQEPVDPRCLRPEVDRDLEAVCLKCLRKDPATRYASAGALADDLRRFLDGQPTAARPLSWADRAWRYARRRPFVSATAVLLLWAAVVVPLVAHRLDPQRAARDNLQRLERGESVTLIGETGGPRWSRWVLGKEVSSEPEGDVYTIGSGDRHLLELMAAPPARGYVFSAEVRHNSDFQGARVGLYVAYEARESPGGTEHSWAALTFNDHDPSVPKRGGPPETRAQLYGERCRPPALLGFPAKPTLTVAFPALQPSVPPMPWRPFKIRLTPDDVQVWCAGLTAGPRPLSELRDDFETVNALLKLQGEPELRPGFTPAGGIGLYVYRASASFRRVVIEPL
jgi:serine/threonine-protein kinase